MRKALHKRITDIQEHDRALTLCKGRVEIAGPLQPLAEILAWDERFFTGTGDTRTPVSVPPWFWRTPEPVLAERILHHAIAHLTPPHVVASFVLAARVNPFHFLGGREAYLADPTDTNHAVRCGLGLMEKARDVVAREGWIYDDLIEVVGFVAAETFNNDLLVPLGLAHKEVAQ